MPALNRPRSAELQHFLVIATRLLPSISVAAKPRPMPADPRSWLRLWCRGQSAVSSHRQPACKPPSQAVSVLLVRRLLGGWKGVFIINSIIFVTILVAGIGFGCVSHCCV